MSVEQTVKERIIDYLKSIAPRSDIYENIQMVTGIEKKVLGNSLKELVDERKLSAVPIKKAGNWRHFYYVSPEIKEPIDVRLEIIFEELAIPPYIDIKLNRGFKVIIIGEPNKKPGLSIIDYNKTPPLVFRDKTYGGKKDEIIYSKSKSRYLCKKEGKEIWYNLHGRRMKEIYVE
jgi:hypothetical protein